MCGIVGLQLRAEAHRERLGELIAAMLGQLRDRGPDSAGVGLYGDASLCQPGGAAVSVLAGDVPASDLAEALRRLLPGLAVDVTAVAEVRVATAPVTPAELTAAVRTALPAATLLGSGTDLVVLKGIGDPLDLARSFALDGRAGFQAVGHTRMATESGITWSPKTSWPSPWKRRRWRGSRWPGPRGSPGGHDRSRTARPRR